MAKWNQRRGMVLGATPGRLCLVVVLGMILIVVVYRGVSPSGSVKARSTAQTPSRTTDAGSTAPSTPKSSGPREMTVGPDKQSPCLRSREHDKWNGMALDLVRKHDPFAAPAAFLPPPSKPADPMPKPAGGTDSNIDKSVSKDQQRKEREKQAAAKAKARDDALNALAKQGVRVVLHNGKQWIAIVGDQTIRVGDQLGSFHVIEILPNGVVIEDRSSP